MTACKGKDCGEIINDDDRRASNNPDVLWCRECLLAPVFQEQGKVREAKKALDLAEEKHEAAYNLSVERAAEGKKYGTKVSAVSNG